MTKGVVVVLGKTGRNFAAGMSGGVAYVLDEDGDFRTRCNMGLVAVDSLPAADADTLSDLIQRHLDLTGSGVATRLLASWSEAQERFVRVMPVEYAKVLATQHLDTEAARVAAV
jgi:glutamate synthase (ferredoxin)